MPAQIVTVPRVYLRCPEHFGDSRHHIARAPAPVLPDAQPGADQPQVILEFWYGVAYDVPENLYRIFKDLGIATTEMPDQRPGTQLWRP